MIRLDNDWNELLSGEFNKDYYIKLMNFIDDEYKTKTIYPQKENIYDALNYTAFKDVKVVILGQDPYHGEGQAHGMSFSVKPGVKTPPSLLNIYKEIKEEMGYDIPNNGYLLSWAKQGVLLLNTVLTVRAGEPNSHSKKGWEIFTDEIIKLLDKRESSVIFLLWGSNARKKKDIIKAKQHYVLESAHPSPLSARRGFFKCNHFIEVNSILKSVDVKTIDWKIPNI